LGVKNYTYWGHLVGIISGLVFGEKTQNLRVRKKDHFFGLHRADCSNFPAKRCVFNCRKDLKEENGSARTLGEKLTIVSCGRAPIGLFGAGKSEIGTGAHKGCWGEEGKFRP